MLLEDGTLSKQPEKVTTTRDNIGLMMLYQRPLRLFMMKRHQDQLTSEVEMLTLMPLIQDGTNFSNMIMVSLRTRKVKFLAFKANLIMRIDKLLERTEMMSSNNLGYSLS